jgi:hypothetical protein
MYLHSILRFRGLCSKEDINFNFLSSKIPTCCITKGAWCGFTLFRTDKLCSISGVTCETRRNSASHLADSPTHTQSQRLKHFPCYLHVTTATLRDLYIRLLTIFLASGLDVLKNHDRSYGTARFIDQCGQSTGRGVQNKAKSVFTGTIVTSNLQSKIYRVADESLARPGRKQATATEDFDFRRSYL